MQYVINPIVTVHGQSAVNITNHPLVALFSAGPCTAGHSIRVRFRQNGSQATSTTNAVPCSTNSANFLVAGMLAIDAVRNALGRVRHQLPEQRPRPVVYHRASAQQLSHDELFTVNIPATQHDAAFPWCMFHLIPDFGRPFTFWPTRPIYPAT